MTLHLSRKLIIPLMFLGVLSVVGSKASALGPLDDVCSSGNTNGSVVCQDRGKTTNPITGPTGILTRVIGILSYFIGVAAVIVIIIAGLRFMTARGDPNSISAARSTILYALVGLLIAVFAQLIVLFVLKKL